MAFSLFPLVSRAQQGFQTGYLITSNGDTLTGWVGDVLRAGTIEFKSQQDDTAEAYSAATIGGFGYTKTDRYFEGFTLPDDGANGAKVFAEMLFRGRADLLSYEDFFYLRKDGKTEKIGKTQTRETNDRTRGFVYEHKVYIGTLNRYFSDCMPKRLLAGDVAYNEKDFVDVFKKYSQCAGSQYHQYKDRAEPSRLSYTLLAGLNNSSISWEGPLDIFENDNNFFVGAGIVVPMGFIGRSTSLTGEIIYNKNVYRGMREGFIPSGTVQKDYRLELAAIKIPIGVKVDLSRKKFSPYLRAGLTSLFHLRVNWTISYNGTVEQDFDPDEKTASLVYWGGLGLRAPIAGRTFFFEFRGEKATEYIGFHGPEGATGIPSYVVNKMLIFGVNL